MMTMTTTPEVEADGAEAARTTALGPESFSEYVGQTRLKERLDVHMRAALTQNRPMEHVLLSGPAGSGKTTLAYLIAQRLGEKIAVVNRPVNERALLDILYDLEAGILFLDEAHRLSKGVQESLLGLAQDGEFQTKWGTERYDWLQIVLATTEPEKIIPPLFDRMMVRPTFDPYTDGDMAEIALGMARRAGVELDMDTALVLGRASGGVPRNARSLVLAYRDLSAVGLPHTAGDVLEMCQVSPDGLTRNHEQFLQFLLDVGGCAGLSTLSAQLRLHPSMLKDLERLLTERGFIRFTSSGRTLTAAGRRRITGERAAGRQRPIQDVA